MAASRGTDGGESTMVTEHLLARVTPRNLLLALVAFVGFSLISFRLGPYARLGVQATGMPLLDQTFLYTPAQVSATLTTYGADGRRAYIAFLALDMLYPFFYIGAVGLLLAFTMRRLLPAGRLARPFLLIPVAAGIGDWLENVVLLGLVLAYPAGLAPLALVAAGITATKLVLVNASFLLAAVGVVGWLAKSLYQKVRATAPLYR